MTTDAARPERRQSLRVRVAPAARRRLARPWSEVHRLLPWQPKRSRGVLVLGMHRSGTSAATRMVNMLGPATCAADDMVRGPWNPSGHWESRTLMHLDDALLREMGRTWWYPPPSGEEYLKAAADITTTSAKAQSEFRRVHPKGPWVWKDPRACLLIPFWRAALGPDVVAIVVVRNPLEVAASLARRHDFSPPFGVALWERYNRLLLAHLAGMPVLVSRYSDLVADPARWQATARAFLSASGLALHRPRTAGVGASGFIDPELRHSTFTRADVGAEAPGALEILDGFDAVMGPVAHFVPPALGPEDPWVADQLALVGPGRTPAWRPPPWAAAGESSARGRPPSRLGPRP